MYCFESADFQMSPTDIGLQLVILLSRFKVLTASLSGWARSALPVTAVTARSKHNHLDSTLLVNL
jgi:hypothetical protein